MKAVAWRRRLDCLSEKLSDVSPLTETKIDPNCLTERERLLLGRVSEVLEKCGSSVPPVDVLLENAELFSKASEIVARRALDLFVSVMPKILGGEVEAWYFKLHFYNFMVDLGECIRNVSKWSEKDREDFLLDMKQPKQLKKPQC